MKVEATCSLFERVRVKIRKNGETRVLEYLYANGWKVTRNGPSPTGPGRFDPSQALVRAERLVVDLASVDPQKTIREIKALSNINKENLS